MEIVKNFFSHEIRELNDDDKMEKYKSIIILGEEEVNGESRCGQCLLMPFIEGEAQEFIAIHILDMLWKYFRIILLEKRKVLT